MRLARILGGIGRVLITAGVLILLFVAYQLWGTALSEARAQNKLEEDFAEILAEPEPDDPVVVAAAEPGVAIDGSIEAIHLGRGAPPPPPPEGGDAVAQIRIPKIGLDKIVVEGVSVDDLKRGPGHYPDTPLPGQPGNAAIAGHRTTYGAPFFRLNELSVGDQIFVTTQQGQFEYQVTGHPEDGAPDAGYLIVHPTETSVLDDAGDNRLTLTTCHPRYSAARRLIVTAELIGEAAAPSQPRLESTGSGPTLPGEEFGDAAGGDVENAGDEGDGAADEGAGGVPLGETDPVRETIDEELGGDPTAKVPAFLWGLAAALAWLWFWLLGRFWRRWPAYAMGSPVFLVLLFVFFENFSRLLPANF